jgi:DeoR family fructose operon transcriptional repressor
VLSAERVVALVDSSKVGVESAVRFAGLDEVDALVTDDAIRPADRAAFTRAGTDVVSA